MNSDDTQALRDLAARVFARTWDREAYELATAVSGLLDTLAMRTGQLIQARANADEEHTPSQWAYDQACKALAHHRQIADEATNLLLRLGSWGLDRSKQDDLLAEARQLRRRFEAPIEATTP